MDHAGQYNLQPRHHQDTRLTVSVNLPSRVSWHHHDSIQLAWMVRKIGSYLPANPSIFLISFRRNAAERDEEIGREGKRP